MPNSENILVTSNDHFEVIEKTTLIDASWPTHEQAVEDLTLDHFICRDGKVFAGTHIIADFWGASRLDDLQLMERALREGVAKANATLLHIHLHHFTPNGGISGVAVLAESHISVHSWPERQYAAFDVFMCGDSDPMMAIEVLKEAFTPSDVKVDTLLRGEVINSGE
jgi:S-adenosylmethionine decarboxylase